MKRFLEIGICVVMLAIVVAEGYEIQKINHDTAAMASQAAGVTIDAGTK